MLERLFTDIKNRSHSVLVGRAIRRPPFIDDKELIDFTAKLTNIDKETISRVLEAEFVFLRLKGVVE